MVVIVDNTLPKTEIIAERTLLQWLIGRWHDRRFPIGLLCVLCTAAIGFEIERLILVCDRFMLVLNTSIYICKS